MNSKNSVGNPIRGLTHLMRPDGVQLSKETFEHMDQANEHHVPHSLHPFGLPVGKNGHVVFTGGGYNYSNNTVIINFLAYLRFWTSKEGNVVRRLRVITTPVWEGDHNQHFVFFEVKIADYYFISGETTDFPSEARGNMCTLEDVFALLSQTYNVEIERISTGIVPLKKLYSLENVEAMAV